MYKIVWLFYGFLLIFCLFLQLMDIGVIDANLIGWAVIGLISTGYVLFWVGFIISLFMLPSLF